MNETCAPNGMLNEASLMHLLDDLGDGIDEANLGMDTKAKEQNSGSSLVDHTAVSTRYYSEPKSATIHHHENKHESNARSLPVFEILKENYNNDPARIKAISRAPSPILSTKVLPPLPPLKSRPPTDDSTSPMSPKSARKRRMDLMSQRKLGRYHIRQKVSHDCPQITPDQLEIAAKAAVTAVLDTFPNRKCSRPATLPVTKRLQAETPEKIKRLKDDGDSPDVAAAMEAVKLPDGDDVESRRQRRLIRNRMSAQLHRERKREAMDMLKREIEERDDKIDKLKQQLEQALYHSSTLESSLNVIKDYFGTSTIDNILQQTVPLSPPHIVNNTSDSSSASDNLSAPPSPVLSTDIMLNQFATKAESDEWSGSYWKEF